MILKELSRQEGIAFIQLVLEFVRMDKVLCKEQEYKIDEYKKELNITDKDLDELSFTESLCFIKEASDRTRHIIYFELLGLALVDGEYEDHEVGFLEELSNSLKIDRVSKFKYANFYYDYIDSYSESSSLSDKQREDLRAKAVEII